MDKNIVYFTNRKEWREWLLNHFESEKEVWFTFPTVSSGEIGVSYNDAVEEALCFGWIDGIANTLDEKHQLRRFTPRRKGSGYSRLNIERLIHLYSEGLIHPSIESEIKKIIDVPYIYPKKIINELKKDEEVWNNFESFSDSYKRIRVAYIDSAKSRPKEYKKRLKHFILKTKENKIINGYGGADKYYK